LEEERVARAAIKARAAGIAKEAAKRKNEKSSRHYFPQFPLRSEGTVDPATSSPIKKKHKNDDALGTVIEIDMDLEEEEDPSPSVARTPVQEAVADDPMTVSPPEPQSILRKKKMMLEAAALGVEPNANPFPAPKMPGSNKEGIPPSEFVNEVFIEMTFTIPPKPKDFVGTDTKWAISQIMDWFKQSQTWHQTFPNIAELPDDIQIGTRSDEKHEEIPTRYYKLGEEIYRPIPSEYPGSQQRELLSNLR
jgi:hypothetical protein